jgi:hypothetical protein
MMGTVTPVPFPEEWKSRISERIFQQASYYSGTTGLEARAPKRTLVGGNKQAHPQKQQANLEEQQKERAAAIKHQVPEMDRVLDEYAMNVAIHHGIGINDVARLYLTSYEDVDTLTHEDQALFHTIDVAYRGLTIKGIKIPFLSIVAHMRTLQK